MQHVEIPAGFKQDAKGRLIPETQIKPIELERDDLTQALIENAKTLQEQMQAFKRQAFNDVTAFVQLSAEQYDIKIGGNKGNITLLSTRLYVRFKTPFALTSDYLLPKL